MQIKNLLLPKSAGQRAGQQAASASLSQLWRPQAGVCGVTAYGHFDFFGLMPCDVAKDATLHVGHLAVVLKIVVVAKLLAAAAYGIRNQLHPREAKDDTSWIRLVAYR